MFFILVLLLLLSYKAHAERLNLTVIPAILLPDRADGRVFAYASSRSLFDDLFGERANFKGNLFVDDTTTSWMMRYIYDAPHFRLLRDDCPEDRLTCTSCWYALNDTY